MASLFGTAKKIYSKAGEKVGIAMKQLDPLVANTYGWVFTSLRFPPLFQIRTPLVFVPFTLQVADEVTKSSIWVLLALPLAEEGSMRAKCCSLSSFICAVVVYCH